MGTRRAKGRRSSTAMVAGGGGVGRWFGALMAVPLAAGGANSSCEVDAPPPGAEADEPAGDRAEDYGSHQDGSGNKDRGGNKDGKKAEAVGDRNKKERGRSREIVCLVSADAPAAAAEGSPFIVGEASYWCESPGADRLTVIVRIQQRHHDGTWVTVATSRDTVVGVQTLRTEKHDERVRQAKASCQSGTFRTLVVARNGAGGDTKVVVDNSFQRTDPCD